MHRSVKHLGGGAILDLLAAIHDHDAVGDFGHHTHVVRDEDHRHVHLRLQHANQRQYLRLDDDVERRGGHVGDEQADLPGQRHGDQLSALAHASGQLMRKAVEHARSFGHAHLFEHAARFLACCGSVLVLVQPDGFPDLVADGEDRFSEVIGSWKIIAISSPRIARIVDADAFARSMRDSSARANSSSPAVMRPPPCSTRRMSDSAVTDLPDPGFPDDGDGLVTIDRERNIAHGVHHAFGGAKFH